jgi:hypothetical protein
MEWLTSLSHPSRQNGIVNAPKTDRQCCKNGMFTGNIQYQYSESFYNVYCRITHKIMLLLSYFDKHFTIQFIIEDNLKIKKNYSNKSIRTIQLTGVNNLKNKK